MRTCTLGPEGPAVSVIGFGAWALGGPWEYGWGPTDDQAGIAAIHQALDSGITLVDTADVYGFGHSEEIVGQALAGRRQQVFLATKGGTAWDASGKTSYNSRAAYLQGAIEASLRRLGTDYVDLYQIHWPDPTTPCEETARALEDILASGKTRYVGVSNFSPNQMELLGCQRLLTTQNRYNLLEREAEAALLPFCRQQGVSVLAYAPLAHGLLTGKFTTELSQHLAPDDMRWRKRCFNPDNLPRNLRLVAGLKELATELGRPLPQLAINWVLQQPGVPVALVGGRNPQQVRETAASTDWSLDQSTLDRIEAICEVNAQ